MGSVGGRLLLGRRSMIHSLKLIYKHLVMLVAALTCLAFIVLPSNSSPLPVLVPSNLRNPDYLEREQSSVISSNEQKLNAPPFQCRAPPCTLNRILHRAKRTIDLFPFSLLKVSLLGARLQIFPDAPFGANNYALFDFELKVPKELAFLAPRQGYP